MSSATSTTRPEWAWALYDWANSAFAVTVMAGFFPLFFKRFWSDGLDSSVSTFWLGFGNSTASLLVFLFAPILGALADLKDNHVRLLTLFALLGIGSTLGFSAVEQGQWALALLVYVFAILGFSGANIFYDALLPRVARADDQHRMSALGFAMGYLGGGILFAINVAMTLKPGWFGLSDATEAVRWSFASVAVWWLVFMVPIMRLKPPVPEQALDSAGKLTYKSAYQRPLQTLAKIRTNKNLWLFLIAYWFYIDGLATIIRMAVDFGLSIGLPSNSLIVALLIVQFVGFPATIVFGKIAKKYGAKAGLWIGLSTYIVATGCAAFMTTTTEFYLLAVALGLVQGGVQSLSRSIFSQLIPKQNSGEYFGFLNMLGKSAAIIGPVLVGIVNVATGNPRIGIVSIISLFVIGMWFLYKVEDPDKIHNRSISTQ